MLSQDAGCSLAPSGRGGPGEPLDGRVLLLSRCCGRAWEDRSLPSCGQDPGPSGHWAQQRSRAQRAGVSSASAELAQVVCWAIRPQWWTGRGRADPFWVRLSVVSLTSGIAEAGKAPGRAPSSAPSGLGPWYPYSPGHTSLPILTTHGKI